MVLCHSKSEGRAEIRVQRKLENNGQTSHHREDCSTQLGVLVHFHRRLHTAHSGA